MAFFYSAGVIGETILTLAELAVDPGGGCDALFEPMAVY